MLQGIQLRCQFIIGEIEIIKSFHLQDCESELTAIFAESVGSMGISVDDVAFYECDASDTESVASSTEKPVEIASSIEKTAEIALNTVQPIEIKSNVNGKCFILQYHAHNLFTSS